MTDTKFLATVDYEPDRLRRKSNATDESEVMQSIDSALMDSSMTSHISVDALPKSLGLFIEMSTGHVTETTMQLIDANKAACSSWLCEHGAFLSTSIFNDDDVEISEEMPVDLHTILRYAHKQGARFVLLDCDAENIDGLPVYDW